MANTDDGLVRAWAGFVRQRYEEKTGQKLPEGATVTVESGDLTQTAEFKDDELHVVNKWRN